MGDDPFRSVLRSLVVIGLAFAVSGCGLFGDDDEERLPGERISVLQLERDLEPDPSVADIGGTIPLAARNENWPQAFANAAHNAGHLALGASLSLVWRADIGAGVTDDRKLTAQPIMAGGRVFAMGTEGRITALDANTGARLWRVRVVPPHEAARALGGGISFAQDQLFVTSGYGDVLSLDPTNGGAIWRTDLRAPARAAPTVVQGRAFVSTVDNQLFALDANNGQILWSHAGLLESTGILGAAVPAVDQQLVVAGFSSGELVGLRVENGRVVWSDSLVQSRFATVASLSDIRGAPIIDRGVVVGVSHGGRMVAIDQRSGVRIWQQEVQAIETPWIAGDAIFLVTIDGALVAIARRTGQVGWAQEMGRFRDPEDRDDPIIWTGPVLAGNRLIIANNWGQVREVDPADGTILAEWEAGDGVEVAPVVAAETLLLVTRDGTVEAYR